MIWIWLGFGFGLDLVWILVGFGLIRLGSWPLIALIALISSLGGPRELQVSSVEAPKMGFVEAP